MPTRNTHRSPSPSTFGYRLDRRGLLQGAVGAAALGLTLPAGIARAQVELGTATGEVTLGSNYSNALPKEGLAASVAALPNKNVTAKINTVDHNTFQENITTYLQNPDDVLAWFAGYRMRFFAAQDLLGDISDVWEAGLNDSLAEGFKIASTGDDGKQYFVPMSYYCWGIHFRPSVFEENGWTAPTTMDELQSLASNMQDKGMLPFAFGNGGRWPAMGTFDQLNFRLNGYQFHMDLMAGKEKWTDERVKDVFTTWESLLPLHQENPNGRTWEEAAAAILAGDAGMMTIGNFIGNQFPEGDTSDLDFFTFPELNPEHGTGTIEAPIDGWMMAKEPSNEAAAKELLYHFGTAAGQEAYLAIDPSVVVPAEDVDQSLYSPLQKKAFEAVAAAPNVTQFLDRDTSPEFASNVAGQAFADFLADPSGIDSILEDMQAQAEAIFSE
ncbi:MAG: ABC transporter substrate-binding protein [Chloroflexota bacterium]|nr:ABC transporter substrate-binding protein [Chloroflexota bacterium]